MERGRSILTSFLMVVFAVLLAITSCVSVSSTHVSSSHLDHSKTLNDPATPSYAEVDDGHYLDDVKTDGADLERGPARNPRASLEEHDPDDRFLEASSAEALALNMTSDSGNYTSNVIVVHNDTWDGTGDNGTLVIPENPGGNASTSGSTIKGHLGKFESLINNTVTRLVLKEIRNISYVYKKYFALLYNVSLADVDENAAHDEPSNIIELVEEALSLNDTEMAPGCKMTPVTVYICTIRVFHVGVLPADIVDNYNEDALQGLICPCPVPVPGFLCPMYSGNFILERYRERCRH